MTVFQWCMLINTVLASGVTALWRRYRKGEERCRMPKGDRSEWADKMIFLSLFGGVICMVALVGDLLSTTPLEPTPALLILLQVAALMLVAIGVLTRGRHKTFKGKNGTGWFIEAEDGMTGTFRQDLEVVTTWAWSRTHFISGYREQEIKARNPNTGLKVSGLLRIYDYGSSSPRSFQGLAERVAAELQRRLGQIVLGCDKTLVELWRTDTAMTWLGDSIGQDLHEETRVRIAMTPGANGLRFDLKQTTPDPKKLYV